MDEARQAQEPDFHAMTDAIGQIIGQLPWLF